MEAAAEEEEPREEVLSEDSGVEDVRPQVRLGAAEAGRRNKRKSSEPRKRKEVLLMKRFRWDTDEEEEDVEERPGSGDSGCQWSVPDPNPSSGKRRRKTQQEAVFCRQSVIRKNETHSEPNEEEEEKPTKKDEDDHCVREEEGRVVPPGGRPRNYKSMSRQRRIEANARERTRVHTISAAFESLRRAVPAYAHNQKLSKLAILRIASAYIVALACLNRPRDPEEEEEEESPSMADCVEQCTRTLQAEGRSRRRTANKD